MRKTPNVPFYSEKDFELARSVLEALGGRFEETRVYFDLPDNVQDDVQKSAGQVYSNKMVTVYYSLARGRWDAPTSETWLMRNTPAFIALQDEAYVAGLAAGVVIRPNRES